MKKVIFLIGSMLLTGSLMAGSNVAVNTSAACVALQDDSKKEKITEDKLPQPVKDVLASDNYKGWKIDVIYLVKGEKEFYQITLKKDANTKSVNLDKDGNVVI